MAEEFLSSYDLLISPSERLIKQLNNYQQCNEDNDETEIKQKFVNGQVVSVEAIRKLANHLPKGNGNVFFPFPYLRKQLKNKYRIQCISC